MSRGRYQRLPRRRAVANPQPVALGPELAALFCNDEALAQGLLAAAAAAEDPMWRIPLRRPYRKMIR